MKLQFKLDNLREGRGKVICWADLTLQVLKGDGKLLDLVTVRECGLCPSKRGGYALLSPSRTWEQNGETQYKSLVGWPQFAYDAACNKLLNAAAEAGYVDPMKPQTETKPDGVSRADLANAGLVDDDPFGDQ